MAKTQKEMDDDVRYRNRFREGGNDEPMARHKKKVFNRATGQFQKPALQRSAKEEWSKILKGTTPRPMRERKSDVDKAIKKGGG
ncbi:MAG: hypothetical protein OER87_07575 [Gammaproteobacteria bacterium]|nr:hypothetical protein [Gammaproteobacteria bacterium]MDH3535588.1 hypothetical protein [Gammaproteobacteria bacterium]